MCDWKVHRTESRVLVGMGGKDICEMREVLCGDLLIVRPDCVQIVRSRKVLRHLLCLISAQNVRPENITASPDKNFANPAPTIKCPIRGNLDAYATPIPVSWTTGLRVPT